MNISFLVNPVVDGWKPTDTRLGGTEESVVRWAEELFDRGHSVRIYQNGFVGSYNQVTYYPREEYLNRAYNGWADVCINIKSPEVSPKELTFYLTNETDATRLDLSAYKAVIWPSKWANDNIPVNNKTVILPHGYDSEKIKPSKKISKQVLYASSPDRGLDLLLACWPSVYEAHPDANLIVTYGAPAQDIPGVTFLGEVDEGMMNELYATSDVWAHPCSGGELYGITGIKAQASGCVPVYIPTMALAETVRHGVACDEFNFRDRLIQTLGNEKLKANIREQLSKEDFVDWKKSTTILENIIGANNG
jgi:glycosyltransferase involved in cell wall biosynthesis